MWSGILGAVRFRLRGAFGCCVRCIPTRGPGPPSSCESSRLALKLNREANVSFACAGCEEFKAVMTYGAALLLPLGIVGWFLFYP